MKNIKNRLPKIIIGMASCLFGLLAFTFTAKGFNNNQNYTIAKAEGVAPDAIEIVAPKTSIDINETLQLSAVCTKSGDSEGVDQSVTWSVTNGNYYGHITSDGLFTAFKNGTMNIRATSTNGGVMKSINIEVTGQKSDAVPVTICPENLELEGYSAGLKNVLRYRVVNGVAIEIYNVFLMPNDRLTNPINYTKGSMYGISSDDGYIKIITPAGHKINKVIVSASEGGCIRSNVEASDDVTWASGFVTASGNSSVSSSVRVNQFPLSTAKNYVRVALNKNNYFNSFTFFYEGGTHTASSFADYVNGIQPDRNDVIGNCTGNANFYKVVKDAYIGMSEESRLDFQANSSAANVVKARTRYEQWARVYGDSTPYSLTYSPSAKVLTSNTVNNGENYIIVVVLAVALMISASIFISFKKRKRNQ